MHMKQLNDFLFWHLYVQNTQTCSNTFLTSYKAEALLNHGWMNPILSGRCLFDCRLSYPVIVILPGVNVAYGTMPSFY